MNHCEYGRTLDEAGLARDQHDDCMKWAFGDDYKKLKIDGSQAVWNDKHGKLFKIDRGDNILLTILSIGYAYLDLKLVGV